MFCSEKIGCFFSGPNSSITEDVLGAAANVDFCGESVASSHVTDVSIEIEDVTDVTGDDRSTASSRDAHSTQESDEGAASGVKSVLKNRQSQQATLKTTEEWLKSNVKPLALKKNASDVTQLVNQMSNVKVTPASSPTAAAAAVDAFDPLAPTQLHSNKTRLRRSASDLNQSEAKKHSSFNAQTPPEVRSVVIIMTIGLFIKYFNHVWL